MTVEEKARKICKKFHECIDCPLNLAWKLCMLDIVNNPDYYAEVNIKIVADEVENIYDKLFESTNDENEITINSDDIITILECLE